jgi:uncharacterized protein
MAFARSAGYRLGAVATAFGVLVTLAMSVPVGATQNPRPSWWSYTRPTTYRQVKTQLHVPVGGADLQCELSRPGISRTVAARGRFPALLADYTPYATQVPSFTATDGAYFSKHGYAVLVCVVPGAGSSTGTYQCCLSPQEVRDGAQLVEWIARQRWSDGRVGMEGASYGGMTTMAVAALHPAHLMAIAPQQFPDSWYLDAIYPGGMKTTPYQRDSWPTLIGKESGGRISSTAIENDFLANPTIDAFWRSFDIDTKFEAIRVPVLDINAGRPDVYFRGSLAANYAALKSRGWIIVGPWTHGFWSGNSYQQLPLGVELAWFDHWVAERPGAPLPPASQRLESYEEPVGVGHGWESLDGWPPSDVGYTRLYLSLGKLSRRPGPATTESYTGAPGHPAANPPCPLFDICPRPAGARGGYLVYDSTPFTRDTVVTGQIGIHLVADANAPDANLYAEVFDVAPDGRATFVDDGALKASHRDSNVDPTPLTPGATTTFSFSIWPINWRFAAGHELRLRLSAGAADEFLPAEPFPVTVTVAMGRTGSYVTLPVRGQR